jgi:hypothetical protein
LSCTYGIGPIASSTGDPKALIGWTAAAAASGAPKCPTTMPASLVEWSGPVSRPATIVRMRDQPAGDDRADLVQDELERGGDAEVPAAAPHRPEQIRVVGA